MDIIIYSKNHCPYCVRAKQLLERKKLSFKEINIEDDAGLREEMIQRSQRRTVPQIFIGDHHIGGCDDLYALDAQGDLDKIIAQATR